MSTKIALSQKEEDSYIYEKWHDDLDVNQWSGEAVSGSQQIPGIF